MPEIALETIFDAVCCRPSTAPQAAATAWSWERHAAAHIHTVSHSPQQGLELASSCCDDPKASGSTSQQPSHPHPYYVYSVAGCGDGAEDGPDTSPAAPTEGYAMPSSRSSELDDCEVLWPGGWPVVCTPFWQRAALAGLFTPRVRWSIIILCRFNPSAAVGHLRPSGGREAVSCKLIFIAVHLFCSYNFSIF